jgi:murein DD-endopeptidase MepM/ murein hydrolase activator NlpD
MSDFFTNVPPFLLPIYQAAGIEYDVPWQVLAAINQVETDYGRNLSLSSAGAVGWMQFLPSTWKRYGVDATRSGYADPYNPVDAIFAAARYLHAAGASKNLARAIFAYNHATWYVQSVLLRAELIGSMPASVLDGLTSLVDGRFPVAARATLARAGSTAARIYAPTGSRVIAVSDGKVLEVGRNRRLGRYLLLEDAAGNVYTYAHLGSLVQRYAVPASTPSTAAAVARQLGLPATPRVSTTPASGGTQTSTAPPSVTVNSTPSMTKAATEPASAGFAKERLFVYPSRPDSFVSGGARQLSAAAAIAAAGQSNASGSLRIHGKRYTVAPLRAGAIVPAGTVLGRVGARTQSTRSGLEFKVKPAQAPYVDAEPILNAWHLLDATSIYAARNGNPLLGGDPMVGLALLMSERQLEHQVLRDPRIHIDSAGRAAIAAGLVDRRILAVLAFLSAAGLNPTVSELAGGKVPTQLTQIGDGGPTVEITKINSIPILGHQGAGSITAAAIRLLLTLQGTFRPEQIVSLMSYSSQTNVIALPDHADRIQITFTPTHAKATRASRHTHSNTLRPDQWTRLFERLAKIAEPGVPISRSTFAVKDKSDATIAR